MSACRVELKGREAVAEGTFAFHFEKPARFSYKPGQAVEIAFIDPTFTDAQGTNRAFSIVSAPFENELVVTTRVRSSPFKQALKAAPIGSQVSLDGPFGSLTLHNNRARRAVFIAGGIGITPFMSILRQAAHDRLPGEFLLLYSNRRPEEAAFLEELGQLRERIGNFRLVATMTQASRPWRGETRRIDADFLKRTAGDLSGSVCYVAGPPELVAAMRQALNLAGADDDDIRSEEFFGY